MIRANFRARVYMKISILLNLLTNTKDIRYRLQTYLTCKTDPTKLLITISKYLLL